MCVQISEGYKNVAQLLDHLNVDASNPLAVLTQVRQMLQGVNLQWDVHCVAS